MPKKSVPSSFAQNKRGFTLIELLVVLSIIAILATIGIVLFSGTQKTAQNAKRKGDLQDIKTAMYLYRADAGTFCFKGVGKCGTTVTVPSWYRYVCHAFYSDLGAIGCPETPGGIGYLKTYLKSYPVDPEYKFGGSYPTYAINITGDNTFEVHAKLSTPFTTTSPDPSSECTLPDNQYNYCIRE